MSPRPDRLTRTVSPLSSEGRRRSAQASAWLLSSAGRMPSRRQRVRNAARASSSVTLS